MIWKQADLSILEVNTSTKKERRVLFLTRTYLVLVYLLLVYFAGQVFFDLRNYNLLYSFHRSVAFREKSCRADFTFRRLFSCTKLIFFIFFI